MARRFAESLAPACVMAVREVFILQSSNHLQFFLQPVRVPVSIRMKPSGGMFYIVTLSILNKQVTEMFGVEPL